MRPGGPKAPPNELDGPDGENDPQQVQTVHGPVHRSMNIYEQIAWEIFQYCDNEHDSVNRLAFMRDQLIEKLKAMDAAQRGAFLQAMLRSLISVGSHQFTVSADIFKRTIDEFASLLPP
jgi:hypothetical protein